MSKDTTTHSIEIERRRRWLGLFAKASLKSLEKSYQQIADIPKYDFIRPPETGMLMVRARTSGVGDQFNLGEITLTRCVIQLNDGTQGYGYTSSRNKRHVELAALFDALLQDDDRRKHLESILVTDLQNQQDSKESDEAAKTAATRVEFFTMVRGDD